MAISVFCQNLRGLRSKTHQFYNSKLNCDFEVVCATETNLIANIGNSELFPSNFTIFRRDRESSASLEKSGGGVFVAVKNTIAVKLRNDWQSVAEDV